MSLQFPVVLPCCAFIRASYLSEMTMASVSHRLLAGGAAAQAGHILCSVQGKGMNSAARKRCLYPFSPHYASVRLLSDAWRGRWRWFGIPLSAGLACLAILQLERTLRREAQSEQRGEEGLDETWQLTLFRQLPARALSRWWGRVMDTSLPRWLRRPLLGSYVWLFGCNMHEAKEEKLEDYESFAALFTRELKRDARPITSRNQLVCPADGRVLHFGRAEQGIGRVEQVKGVSYPLSKFLGPSSHVELQRKAGFQCERELFHIVVYLAPGDCHHFHSPASWKALTRRHFHGELLTVAPWAARKMPGLFVLNERVVLSGEWQYGFFSLTAVGAYNVGSIKLDVDEDLLTNQRGHYRMGQFSDKLLGEGAGLEVGKGERLGCFGMGSTVVLIFEAPSNFQFSVEHGEKVLMGQPLGNL